MRTGERFGGSLLNLEGEEGFGEGEGDGERSGG